MKRRKKYLHYYDPLYEVSRFGDFTQSGKLRSYLNLSSGQVDLNKSILPLINCPEVSRMNWLNQAGFIPLIFPSGTHSRFSHSLGTLHLGSIALNSVTVYCHDTKETRTLFEILKSKSWVEEFLVALFMHDLGHLPFSHTLENNIGLLKILGKNFLTHEEIACELILGKGKIFESFKKKYLHDGPHLLSAVLKKNSQYQKEIICYLITGDFKKYIGIKYNENNSHCILRIMHELVSGSYDLDRIDHYRRDSFFTGLGHSFKPYVLLEGLEYECGNGIVEPVVKPSKDAKGQISTLLFIRDQLHEYCFSDLRNISFNAMLNHALTLHLSDFPADENIDESYSIFSMTDGLLLSHLLNSKNALCREIIEDINKSRPYKCVATIKKQSYTSYDIIEKLGKKDTHLLAGFTKYFDSPDKSWLGTAANKDDAKICYIFSKNYNTDEALKIIKETGIKTGCSTPTEDEEEVFCYLDY